MFIYSTGCAVWRQVCIGKQYLQKRIVYCFSDWPNLLLSYVQITGVSAQSPSHEYGFIGINNSQTVGYNVKEGKLYF